MSAEEILADLLEVRWGTTANWAAHILEDLKAAGYAVVELPKPQPKSDLYDAHFDVLSDDPFVTGPRTPRVCIDATVGQRSIFQLCTPSQHITPAEARSLAAALLAAAAAAEVTS